MYRGSYNYQYTNTVLHCTPTCCHLKGYVIQVLTTSSRVRATSRSRAHIFQKDVNLYFLMTTNKNKILSTIHISIGPFFEKIGENFTELLRKTRAQKKSDSSNRGRNFRNTFIRSPTFRLALHSRTVYLRKAKKKNFVSQSQREEEQRKTEPDDGAVTLNHLDPFLIYVNLERDPIREHDAIARRSGAHTPSDTRHKSGLQARPATGR